MIQGRQKYHCQRAFCTRLPPCLGEVSCWESLESQRNTRGATPSEDAGEKAFPLTLTEWLPPTDWAQVKFWRCQPPLPTLLLLLPSLLQRNLYLPLNRRYLPCSLSWGREEGRSPAKSRRQKYHSSYDLNALCPSAAETQTDSCVGASSESTSPSWFCLFLYFNIQPPFVYLSHINSASTGCWWQSDKQNTEVPDHRAHIPKGNAANKQASKVISECGQGQEEDKQSEPSGSLLCVCMCAYTCVWVCLLERVSSELRVELKGETVTVEEKDIPGRGNYSCKRL